MGRKHRKKIKQQLDPSIQRCHDMMYSDDIEISNLGLSMLKGVVYTYGQYKILRGLSINGKPFFPFKQVTGVVKWKLELIKKKLPKKYLQQQKINDQKFKNQQLCTKMS